MYTRGVHCLLCLVFVCFFFFVLAVFLDTSEREWGVIRQPAVHNIFLFFFWFGGGGLCEEMIWVCLRAQWKWENLWGGGQEAFFTRDHALCRVPRYETVLTDEITQKRPPQTSILN